MKTTLRNAETRRHVQGELLFALEGGEAPT
jgi:hypothetical protein